MNHTEIAQECFSLHPTIILGSGASIPHGLPSMADLAEYLEKHLTPQSELEQNAWSEIQSDLNNGKHLEAALEGKNPPSSLLSAIIELTWRCVNEKDRVLLEAAIANPELFPLAQLLKGIFRSTHTQIDIITTNYDRVAEFACNSQSILFQTGFAAGYIQSWDNETEGVLKFRKGSQSARVVKIWKVHGSLDWFAVSDSRNVSLPIFDLPSEKYEPLIVTPINKFKKITEDPFRTVINEADNALKDASSILCVGYGFRDEQIHPKIEQQCRNKNTPIVVLAKKLTDEAKKFLRNKAGNSYMGIEQCDKGSMIYTPETPEGTIVSDQNLWSLDSFNKLIL